MPTTYRRETWPVRVASNRSGELAVRYGIGRAAAEVSLAGYDLSTWDDEFLSPLYRALAPVRAAFRAWGHERTPAGTSRDVVRLPRMALQAYSPRLHALPWEELLRPASVVHESRVPPRASVPLTLPIRVLEVGLGGPSPAADTQRRLDRDPRSARDALDVRRVRNSPDRETNPVGAVWPNADIIHVAFFAESPDMALSTGSPETPETLGWLDRLAGQWGARLLILECVSPHVLRSAREVAAALVERGGPAVLAWAQPDFTQLSEFLRDVVEDTPLDFALPRNLPQRALFAGLGREDALRHTPMVRRLLQVHEASRRRLGSPPAPPTWKRGGVRLSDSVLLREDSLLTISRARPSQIRTVMTTIDRTFRGTAWDRSSRRRLRVTAVDVGGALREAREAMGATGALRPSEIDPDAQRVVNARFCSWNRGALLRLPQDTPPLAVGRQYHLQVDIGPTDRDVRTYGATGLEDVVAWEPDGAWVEVGVTGLDFEVAGDPVQEMWVPRQGPSQALVFTVIPRRHGLSVLRYCLYVNQNVVQSFRLAARTGGRAPKDGRSADVAVALDIPEDRVGDITWMSRLEYSVEVNPVAAKEWTPRGLSIVANDLEDRPVVTLKGRDLFAVQVGGSISDRVQRLRDAMRHAGLIPVPGVPDDSWPYAYAAEDGSNRGTPEQFARALSDLATVGFELYDSIVPQAARGRLERALNEDDQTIHVAQVLLDKVIPWAALYDRGYRANKRQDTTGNAVAQGVCTAALPDDDGKLAARRCGDEPACLLHPDARSAAGLPYAHDTVVCPRAFWGFRHRIELPAHQVDADGRTVPLVTGVEAGSPVRLAVGVNGGLELQATHVQRLAALDSGRPVTLCGPDYTTDTVVGRLSDLSLDIVYFYCHAEGGEGTGVAPPRLLFREVSGGAEQPCTAQDLNAQAGWDHHPLVIVNGCKTAGFRPDALSDFIVKFVRDRAAGGVLATEIIVWERLATEVAETFLRLFLGGSSAGEALAVARRRLLNQRNPLGLAYTLYGSAALTLGTAPATT